MQLVKANQGQEKRGHRVERQVGDWIRQISSSVGTPEVISNISTGERWHSAA